MLVLSALTASRWANWLLVTEESYDLLTLNCYRAYFHLTEREVIVSTNYLDDEIAPSDSFCGTGRSLSFSLPSEPGQFATSASVDFSRRHDLLIVRPQVGHTNTHVSQTTLCKFCLSWNWCWNLDTCMSCLKGPCICLTYYTIVFACSIYSKSTLFMEIPWICLPKSWRLVR